jgi:hypothetical protein
MLPHGLSVNKTKKLKGEKRTAFTEAIEFSEIIDITTFPWCLVSIWACGQDSHGLPSTPWALRRAGSGFPETDKKRGVGY